MITLTFQLTSSLFQPVIGYITDKRSMPWSLPVGMCFTLCGLILLALAGSFGMVLLAAALVGTGSSVSIRNHPRGADGLRRPSRLAQSLFGGRQFRQLAWPIAGGGDHRPVRQRQRRWFVLAALLAIVVLSQISRWYAAQHRMNKGKPKPAIVNPLPRKKVILAVGILLMLIFSKYFYMASISSYYTFYLMHKFGNGAKRSASSVCLPVRSGCRDGNWRACWR